MNPRDHQASDFVGRMMAAQPRLRAYARMMIYNPSDVNDILQEVAAICWQKYEQYDPARSFDAWAMGVARNCVFEYLRDHGRRASPLNQEAINLLESEAAHASASTSELEIALEACLRKLSAEDHRLIRTRFEQSETNRGVSKLLGISEATVSRTLNRIYAQLLLCIKQQERGVGVNP